MRRKQFFRIITALLAILTAPLVLKSNTEAQVTYKTLHAFKSTGSGGAQPYAGLIFDQEGNLYGTTFYGGAYGLGSVFRLTANGNRWKESVLYSFKGIPDGVSPDSRLIFDTAGNLYGTTWYGGTYGYYGTGTVFRLTPQGDGTWTESVIHSFNCGSGDGCEPHDGLVQDSEGNMYGATRLGGANAWGAVFQLTPNDDGTWTESVIYSFQPANDAIYPVCDLVFDQAGNLYGTSTEGGVYDDGAVFELTPNGDGTWTESVIYSFPGNHTDGWQPAAGLVLDQKGNLYGTTIWGAKNGWYNGVVFELSPNGGGGWTESVLHAFSGNDGAEPWSDLVIDQAGNLYGTTLEGGGFGYGVVFMLKPRLGGGWGYRVLHVFQDRPGAYAYAGLVLDGSNNLYGATYGDGSNTFGSVFEITP